MITLHSMLTIIKYLPVESVKPGMELKSKSAFQWLRASK